MEDNNNQNNQEPKEPTKKEKAEQAGKDVAELAAKGAATYFGGPAGGAIVDKVAQTKAGQKVLNTAGKTLAKNPVTKNVLAKAQPTIQKAKPALDMVAGSMGGAPGGAASGAAKGASSASNLSGNTGLPNQQITSGTNSASSTNNQSSNSGFGSNKSGLFSNDNKQDSGESGTSSGDLIQSLKKAKKIMGIIGAISPIVLPIVFIVIIVVIIMAQIMTVRDSIDQLVQQFTTGIEKLVNFAQGDGWMTNEDSFFNYLDKEYKNFSSTNAGSSQLDIPLIAATIHYSKTSDLEKYQENSDEDSEDYSKDEFETLGGTISKDQTVSFYKVAKDKLGSVNSIWPGQKRLLGHIVKTKVSVEWIDIDAAGSYWSNFFSYFNQSVASTVDDAYWNTPIKYVNPLTAISAFIDTYNKAKAYYDMNKDVLAGYKYDVANLVYETQEFVYTFSELFKASSNLNSDDQGNIVPTEDQNGIIKIPAPIINRTMHYGFEEYKEMKQQMMDIRALLSEMGIELSTREEDLEKAKNSNNQKLIDLQKEYEKNKSTYMYSYTHYLQNVYVPFTYFYQQEYTLAEIDSVVEEIFDQRNFYNYLIGEDFNYSCGGSCQYKVGDKQISNLKVRLLQCSDGNRGKAIPGEDLVEFEKYILGVVYAEIGPDAPAEAAKTQAIAARSYALTRPEAMGNAAGLKLEQEGDSWVLSIRNCTEDQVYCDPDKGCSNTTKPSESGNGTTVYSGESTKTYKYKGPLAADASIRSSVSDVVGKVLLDSSDKIVRTGYTNVNQQKWKTNANSGMDYTQILLSDYTSGAKISTSSCTNVCNAATGDYTQWKQGGSPWSNIIIGSGQTIGNVGCLVTSVSMQIARSGVPLTIPELNPGTFVEAIKPEGFSGANFIWSSTTKVAPTFVHQGSTSLSGLTQSAKASTVQNLINEGCYLVMEVKSGCGGQHWVAVDYVKSNKVYVMDPASTSNDAWATYNQSCTTQVHCYRVSN